MRIYIFSIFSYLNGSLNTFQYVWKNMSHYVISPKYATVQFSIELHENNVTVLCVDPDFLLL